MRCEWTTFAMNKYASQDMKKTIRKTKVTQAPREYKFTVYVDKQSYKTVGNLHLTADVNP